jgi:hypothetical protein
MTLSHSRPLPSPGSPSVSRHSFRDSSRSDSQINEFHDSPTIPSSSEFVPGRVITRNFNQSFDGGNDLPKQLPARLQRLLLTKQVARLVALSLVAGVLYVYSNIVITNNQWNAERQKFEKLQRQYRETLAAGESLNYSMSKGIQNGSQNKNSAYAREKPNQVLFLPPLTNNSNPGKENSNQPIIEILPSESLSSDTLIDNQITKAQLKPSNIETSKVSHPKLLAY